VLKLTNANRIAKENFIRTLASVPALPVPLPEMTAFCEEVAATRQCLYDLMETEQYQVDRTVQAALNAAQTEEEREQAQRLAPTKMQQQAAILRDSRDTLAKALCALTELQVFPPLDTPIENEEGVMKFIQDNVQWSVEHRERCIGSAFLAGAHLYKVQGTNLSEAQLHGASLLKAQLQKASLYGAKLQGASLSQAQMQRASLYKAQLQGANFYKAQLEEADIREAHFQGANLIGARLRGCRVAGSNLDEAYYVDWAGVDFKDHLGKEDIELHQRLEAKHPLQVRQR
jgi:uncharacterized protein YjbI with pentapeptide repeats